MAYSITPLGRTALRRSKTAYPRLTGCESGFRFFSPGMGRWASRDPISARHGMNRYICLSNQPLGYRDRLGLASEPSEQQSEPPVDQCINMDRDQFEDWLKDHGVSVDAYVKRQLDRGCVGVTCIAGDGKFWPENWPDTKCWLTEDDARKDCAKCKKLVAKPCCLTWAKQGKWKDGEPKKLPDGGVSCHAITSARTDNDSYWNYVLIQKGYYIYADQMARPGEEQWFTICRKMPKPPGFPATIYGATCIQTPKHQIPTPDDN